VRIESRRRDARATTLIAIFILCFGAAWQLAALETTAPNTIYDSNPKHLWNRLNETLFQRTAQDGKKFGLDELDILYWFRTQTLLTEPTHQQALAVMDEFIHSHGEKLISDPLKRALLQRDLWELFDWSAKRFWKPEQIQGARELQPRLAKMIRRLALTTNEIAALPDNYAQSVVKGLADLPHELFETNGDWVGVSIRGYNPVQVAPEHLQQFDGHSAFSVMVHMPGGRQAAMDYLESLRRFAQFDHPWMYVSNRMLWVSTNEPRDVLILNTNIPQFATNTEWALARRMCVIDVDGKIQPTPITESIQLRRYCKIEPAFSDPNFWMSTNIVQIFHEFQFDKRHNGLLRSVGKDERGFNFVHFRSQGIDPFEREYRNGSQEGPIDSDRIQSEVLKTCFECHSSRGIFSVKSYTGDLSPLPIPKPLDLAPVPFTREAMATIYWKQRQYDWGLLQGLWAQND
jgi:hypothetical protein